MPSLKPSFAIAAFLILSNCAETRMLPITTIPTPELVNEYKQRRQELLLRLPPRSPPAETDKIAIAAYAAEMQDKSSALGQYARKFFADHLAFAEAGDPRSIPLIAAAYWDGWYGTVDINPCKALPFAFQAANMGEQIGMNILFEAYLTGTGLPKDPKKAMNWALELEHNGYPMPELSGNPTYALAFLNDLPKARQDWSTKWNKRWDIETEPQKICETKTKQ
jgi:hypothetical protein